jgi:hypothetical protein
MLVVILNVTLVNFFVGSFLGPHSEMSEAREFLGYRRTFHFFFRFIAFLKIMKSDSFCN